MKQVFVSQSLIEVEMRKEWLEQAGIRCTIKNQRASGLAGEIPFTETFPELWVLHDQDYGLACQLVEEQALLPTANHDDWICPGCDERHDGQFSSCWKCGQAKPPV